MRFKRSARMDRQHSILVLALTSALMTPLVFAQSTSSGVAGQVLSAQGQPVAGADVIIAHIESGTSNRTTTDGNGRYGAHGLRVGGPYTITIKTPAEGTQREDNIYLNLNQIGTVNFAMTETVATLDTVFAVASPLGAEVFSANKMGTGSNVTRESIETLPSATRNIQDFIRLDPRVAQTSKTDGAISASGQNSRYNAIRIDGIGAGDPFGIEANGFPTERQPVSMDAIEEITIDLANYDTTIFGGTGAVINAVTRSGTNDYRSSVYYSLRDGDWVRSRLRGEVFNGFDKEETWGFTFGGPLVKNTLFFFGNYENYVRTAPGASLAGTPYGRGDITDADINRVVTAARGFGVDPGGVTPPAQSKAEIEEYALKLDWNINSNHRAAARYNKVEQHTMMFPGIGSNSISLSDYWYTQPKRYETWMGELFSNWGDNLSTEVKISHKDWSSIRSPSSPRPSIQIRGFPGNSFINLGIERNTHANAVESRELSLFAAANWYLTDHTVKFGVDRQNNDINNYYGRDQYGMYDFNHLDDFLAGRPNQYTVRIPPSGDSHDEFKDNFTLKNTGLFVQDSWAVNDKLTLMMGVRMDKMKRTRQPKYNHLIDEIYGYNNTYVPNEKLIQPRFGFNYTFDNARPMQLRGGLGLFGGSAPSVWLAEIYSNTGFHYIEYVCTGADAPDFSPSPEPNPGCSSGDSLINVSVVQPGFKLPSNWKTNLAFDHKLPWHGIVASAEALFLKVNDAIYIRRLDLYSDADGNGATTTGQDGRPLFWNEAGLDPQNRGVNGIDPNTNGARTKANRPAGVGDVMLVDNTSQGRSHQFTIGLDKPIVSNWGWSLFYTYTNAKEVSPLGNSQNATTWGFTPIASVNENVVNPSRYAIRDRLSGQLHWKKAFFSNYVTRVSVFYEGRSGRPYSYIFANDANGDATSVNGQGYSNDLFYVPAGPGDVLWTGGEAMEAQFFAWLDSSALAFYKGRIAPANAFRTGWSNTFDMRISQEFPGFFRQHKTEVALDIMNVGNLFNKNWGLIEDYGTNAVSRVAHYAGIDPASGKYVYHFAQQPTGPGIQENNNEKGNTAVSRWSVMLSVRYRF